MHIVCIGGQCHFTHTHTHTHTTLLHMPAVPSTSVLKSEEGEEEGEGEGEGGGSPLCMGQEVFQRLACELHTCRGHIRSKAVQ